MKRAFILLLAISFLAIPTTSAFASVGVGVGTGKISVDEPMRAGGIYTLPAITVFNTGSEEATYSMYVTLNEKQRQLKPNPAWFSFSPNKFTLKPKQSQRVVPTFKPPVVANPGDYFAYLEARPSKTVKQGSAVIGVAAATKLDFKLTSSNIFIGIWYRLLDLYKRSQPWISIVLIAMLAAITYKILRKYIRIDISRTK
jgi:hypothetical protein